MGNMRSEPGPSSQNQGCSDRREHWHMNRGMIHRWNNPDLRPFHVISMGEISF